MILAALADLVRCAVRATHPMRPTFLSDFIVALGFVYKFVNTAHCRQILDRRSLDSTTSSKPNMSRKRFRRHPCRTSSSTPQSPAARPSELVAVPTVPDEPLFLSSEIAGREDQKLARAQQEAGRTVRRLRRLPRTVLGAAITQDYTEQGVTSLIGQTISASGPGKLFRRVVSKGKLLLLRETLFVR